MSRKKTYFTNNKSEIPDLLEQIGKDGYKPVRFVEKPVFREVEENGEKAVKPAGSEIEIECRKI